MEDLSLHVLDIAENGIRAGAKRIGIRVAVDPAADRLDLEIDDDGSGMSEEALRRVRDPFFTTKTVRRVGLGIPLLLQSARMTGGDVVIESEPGRGTRLRARFGLRHIDRPPLGDLAQSLVVLMAGNPGVEFSLIVRAGDEETELDTAELRGEDAGAPWAPALLKALRDRLAEEIARIRAAVGGVI